MRDRYFLRIKMNIGSAYAILAPNGTYRTCASASNKRHPDVVSGVRGIMLGLSLHLYPYFCCASSEGSGESAHAQARLSLSCSAIHLVPKSHVLVPWERSGSLVECLTRDRRAAGSSLTGVTALWSLGKTHLS